MNQTFKLSLKPNDYPPEVPVVYANQYDVGRGFSATILDVDGSEYTFSSETVVICGTKPDGTGFSYDATASGHAVTFATTGQMTVVHGFVRCGIIITQGSTVIGTLAFLMYVQPAPLQTDTIISSDDFGSIITDAVVEWMDDHGVVIDDTLTVSGAAADAKKTGDEIADLKSQIDLGCITVGIKDALLDIFELVAFKDGEGDGRGAINALYAALYYRWWTVTNTLSHCITSNASEQTLKGEPYTATIVPDLGYTLTGATVSVTMGGVDITSVAYSNGAISIPSVTGALVITVSAVALTLSSISAVYTQSGTVYDTVYDIGLDFLKPDLVVTATYTDSSTATVPGTYYTLSGTLSTGTSTVTVSYGGKTATFTVTVTHSDVRFELTKTFNSDGTNYIDTGLALELTKKYTIAYTFTITEFNYNSTSAGTNIGYMYGDRGEGTTDGTTMQNSVVAGGTQYVGTHTWGSGLGYDASLDFASENNLVKFVVTLDISSSSTCVRGWNVKNVTQGTSLSGTQNKTTTNVINGFNIRLGKQENGLVGFTGNISDFKIYDRLLSSAEVSAYLG